MSTYYIYTYVDARGPPPPHCEHQVPARGATASGSCDGRIGSPRRSQCNSRGQDWHRRGGYTRRSAAPSTIPAQQQPLAPLPDDDHLLEREGGGGEAEGRLGEAALGNAVWWC